MHFIKLKKQVETEWKAKMLKINMPYSIKIFLLAFVYYLSGKLSFMISQDNQIVTIVIFAAEGFALAAVLLFGRSMWPGIFIGQFLLAFSSGLSFFPSLAISVINSLEAVLAVTLFYKYGLHKNLNKMRDVYGLFLLIILALQVFSSLLGNLVLLSSSVISWEVLPSSLFSWWFGNAMGQILFTPTILLVVANYKKLKIFELLLIITFFSLLNFFLLYFFKIENTSLIFILTMPILLWIMIEKGVTEAMIGVLTLSLSALYFTSIQVGVFSIQCDSDNIINLNFYILLLTIMVLLIGTLFMEKNREVEKSTTIQKELEELNLTLKSKVDEEVKKNTKQLHILQEQSKMAQMGEMIGAIAHQWRQPLNSISTSIQNLKYDYKEGLLEDEDYVKSFITQKKNTIIFMSQTIDDFRNFYQVEKNKKLFDIKEAIQSVIDIESATIEYYKIGLIFTGKSFFYHGLHSEYQQVILNIINNAKDALVENAIENPMIKIDMNEGDVTIKDNAGGIPLSIIEDIFEPYVTTKKESKGTGIGLYMSKVIIEENMNGRLSVKNDEEGAVFEISLGDYK